MKGYLEFVNEGLFDKLKKKSKGRKYILPSDRDMGELIDEIKKTFDPKKLEWEKVSLTRYWTYELNGIEIKIEYTEYSSKREILIKINRKKLADELISFEILEELVDFFAEKEIEIKTAQNSELFNKTITARRDAEKYNM